MFYEGSETAVNGRQLAEQLKQFIDTGEMI